MTPLLCTACDQDIQPGESYAAADLGDDTGYRYTHQPTCPATATPTSGSGSNGSATPPAPCPPLPPVPDAPVQAARPASSTTRRRRGLHDSTVHELGRMIVAGGPATNSPLVPDAIREQLAVSRTVVREAFRSLEDKGLISARPNVGTHIRPVSDWNLLDPDIIQWRTRGPRAAEQHRELRELRWMTETTAARLASRHPRTAATNAIVTSLHTTVRRMTRAVHNKEAEDFARVDTEFHDLLIKASGNAMLQCLHQIVSQALVHTPAPGWCEPDTSGCAHHQAIADAIDKGSDGAEQAMRELLAEPHHTDQGVVP